MLYDLFISYCRRDNISRQPDEQGWITAFIEELKKEHRRFTTVDLSIFFDKEEIKVAQDWELRLKSALKESRLMIAFLSPSYFASEWCRKEWELYAQHELDRAVGNQGINPIYFVEVPGFENGVIKDPMNVPWIEDLRKRQNIDLRPWQPEGLAALQNEDVQRRLSLLDEQIAMQLDFVTRSLDAPGTVDRHNDKFVGRKREIRRLREIFTGEGTAGVITVVNGLGGVGKSAIVSEYAHAFAAEYTGGRWLLRCEGCADIGAALMQLVTPLCIEFNDYEKKDQNLALRRIYRELEERTQKGRSKKNPNPGCLLILDNVDKPELLSPAQAGRLPKASWLHILATSRLGADQLYEKQPGRKFLALDELPEPDALLLMEKHRKDGKFANDNEKEAARDIVRLLGCFTLAVEGVAVYLGLNSEISCADFLARLQQEGVSASDAVAREDGVAGIMHHREKQLSAALGPMLTQLSEQEKYVLYIAALLPADFVALPWLKGLAEKQFPELFAVKPGYPSQWLQIVRRLMGKRLLVATKDCEENGAPRTVRIHRLVGEMVRRVCRGEFVEEKVVGGIVELAKERCGFLAKGWLQWENRWEIEPIKAVAEMWMEKGMIEGAWVGNGVGLRLYYLARYAEAEPLYTRALAIYEKVFGPEHPDTAQSLNNLALLYSNMGDYPRAAPLYTRALTIQEKVLGPEHPYAARALGNLASLYFKLGDYPRAAPLYTRALTIQEKVLGPEHPDTATSLNNLAWLYDNMGDYPRAEPLRTRALAIREKVLGPAHPDTAMSLNNLAVHYDKMGDYPRAEPLHMRALAIYEKVLGPAHPDTAMSLNNLASLYDKMGDYPRAEPLYMRALAIYEKVLGSEHPDTGVALNNLAGLHVELGDYSRAEPLYTRALAIWGKVLGPEHPNTAVALNGLAGVYVNQGDHARALALRERVLGPEHPSLAQSLHATAQFYDLQGRYSEAEPLYLRALSIREKLLGPEHPDTSNTLNGLGWLYHNMGDYFRAEPLMLRSLAIKEKILGPDHPDVAITTGNLGKINTELKQFDKAGECFLKALAISGKTHGPDHPEYATIILKYQTMLHKSGKAADINEINNAIAILEKAGDKRAERGAKLLAEINQ